MSQSGKAGQLALMVLNRRTWHIDDRKKELDTNRFFSVILFAPIIAPYSPMMPSIHHKHHKKYYKLHFLHSIHNVINCVTSLCITLLGMMCISAIYRNKKRDKSNIFIYHCYII